jgi:signal transduction histidine kinase
MFDPLLTRGRRWLARVGTLRVRLTVAVAILSAAGLAAGGALLVRAVETTVVRAIEDQSRSELHVIGGQVASGVPLTAIRPAAPGRMFSFVRPDGSRVETRWLGPASEPPSLPLPLLPGLRVAAEAAVPGAPAPPMVCEPGVPGATAATPPAPACGRGFVAAPPGSPLPARVGAWTVVQMPLISPEDGPVQAIALSPLEDVLRSTHTLQQVLALGVPVLVVVLTLAAWLLVGRALRPVRVMTHCAAGIADATAHRRLAVPPTADELGELARTLNGMLDRLAEGARRQREFVSDASHELRSPIAATRTQVEVALAHPERVASDAVLRGVLAEVTRLEVLVGDLLALARLDERPAAPHEELDLDDVVLEEAARSRATTVDTRGVTAIKVRGDRKNLCHLVRNLLDNASRYAASRVEASTRIDDGAAVVTIDDDGPGIPEADRARVFERFVRLSSSRTRDGGGAGLGLALVQRIAEQHGGTVRVDRSPHSGARLEVRLPLATGPHGYHANPTLAKQG